MSDGGEQSIAVITRLTGEAGFHQYESKSMRSRGSVAKAAGSQVGQIVRFDLADCCTRSSIPIDLAVAFEELLAPIGQVRLGRWWHFNVLRDGVPVAAVADDQLDAGRGCR